MVIFLNTHKGCHELFGHVEQMAFLEMLGHAKVTDIYDHYNIYQPNVSPPFAEMMAAWQQAAAAVDPLLNALTEEDAHMHRLVRGQPQHENIGTWLLHLTPHMWYHNGEASAIRQLIDDCDLPQMVSSILDWATFG